MTRQTRNRLWIWLLASGGWLSVAGADECQQLRASWDLAQRQLTEFISLEAELKQKYQKFVNDDFVNQSDGVLDDISRGSAIKVVFAQKRLKQAIETKQMDLFSTKNAYCNKCGRLAKEILERAVYCDRCSTSPHCKK